MNSEHILRSKCVPDIAWIHLKLKKNFFFNFLTALNGMRDLSSLTKDPACPPALEVQSLNHWTCREVPAWDTLILKILFVISLTPWDGWKTKSCHW